MECSLSQRGFANLAILRHASKWKPVIDLVDRAKASHHCTSALRFSLEFKGSSFLFFTFPFKKKRSNGFTWCQQVSASFLGRFFFVFRRSVRIGVENWGSPGRHRRSCWPAAVRRAWPAPRRRAGPDRRAGALKKFKKKHTPFASLLISSFLIGRRAQRDVAERSATRSRVSIGCVHLVRRSSKRPASRIEDAKSGTPLAAFVCSRPLKSNNGPVYRVFTWLELVFF